MKYPELLDRSIYFTDVNKITIENDYMEEYLKTNKYLNIEFPNQDINDSVICVMTSPIDTPSANTDTASTVTNNSNNNNITLWSDPLPEEYIQSDETTPKKIYKRGENITPEVKAIE